PPHVPAVGAQYPNRMNDNGAAAFGPPLPSFRRSTMTRLVALLVWAMVLASAATAADAPPGATSCSGCHPAQSGVDPPAAPPPGGRHPGPHPRAEGGCRGRGGKTHGHGKDRGGLLRRGEPGDRRLVCGAEVGGRA